MKPRDYQQYGVDAIFDYFAKGGTGNPLLAYPTGTGKSLIIAAFIMAVFRVFAGQRVIVATHVKELIEQNHDKLMQMWPTAPAGIHSAGLKQRDTAHPIIFGGIQSMLTATKELGHVDLLMIDEAHLVSTKESSSYLKFIAALKLTNPHLKVIGLTATKYRSGQGMLVDDGLFTDLIVDATTMENFNWFIDQGYLCTLIPKRTGEEYDVSKLSMVGGDYNGKQMQEAFDQSDTNYKILAETIELSQGRHHGMIFATGVKHVENVAGMLIDRFGESATFVHSKMSVNQRDTNIAEFKAGKYRWMVNNGILTTGYDDPWLDVLSVMRATNSTGLWVQILGRLTRPFYAAGYDLSTREGRLAGIYNSSKRNGLVLDFAANSKRLGPINDPVLPVKRGKGPKGTAPVRICDACNSYNHASATVCFVCGAEFPRQLKILNGAGTADIIKTKKEADIPDVHTFPIDKVVYNRHDPKDGRASSMKVTYYCGLRRFTEWVTIEHGGSGGGMAKRWWKNRSGMSMPITVDEALAVVEHLTVPTSLDAQLNLKYPAIINFTYPKAQNVVEPA